MSDLDKHTPGPWVSKQDGKYRDSPWSIDHEDGHDASWAPISTEKGRTLAIVVNDDSKRPMDFQEEEMHANANLIAAAPDLLEALEMAEAMLCRLEPIVDRGQDDSISIESEILAARSAIAKARGQS